MSLVQINVVNAGKIEKDLALFPQKAERIYSQAVNRAAELLRDETKRLRPVSKATTGFGAKGIPVDTGRLRQSLHKKSLSKLAAGVYPNVKYGAAVHDGTHRSHGSYSDYMADGSNGVPPRPYFQWALELGAQRKIDDIFERYSLLLP